MAAITILGLAAFTLLYRNYLLVLDRNEVFFTELEEHVIAQDIYVTIVVEDLLNDAGLISTGTYVIVLDDVSYTLTYHSGDGSITYDTGIMSIKIDSTYHIETWQTDST